MVRATPLVRNDEPGLDLSRLSAGGRLFAIIILDIFYPFIIEDNFYSLETLPKELIFTRTLPPTIIPLLSLRT